MTSRRPAQPSTSRGSGSFQKRGGYQSSGPATTMKVPTKLPGAGASPKSNGSSPRPAKSQPK